MNNEQIRFRGNGELHGGETGVHRRRDARDGTGIFHLQSVRRAVVIPDFGGAQIPVAKGDDVGKGSFWHFGFIITATVILANHFLR